MAHIFHELFPIIDISKCISVAVGLLIGDTTTNVSIHEDNVGILVLVNNLPPQFTPCINYYASKSIWFWEEFYNQKIILIKTKTLEQLGGTFTKVIGRVSF